MSLEYVSSFLLFLGNHTAKIISKTPPPQQVTCMIRLRIVERLCSFKTLWESMRSPASAQAALTYTVKLIQEGLLKLWVCEAVKRRGDETPRQGIRCLLPQDQIFPAARCNKDEAQKCEPPPEWAAARELDYRNIRLRYGKSTVTLKKWYSDWSLSVMSTQSLSISVFLPSVL